MSRATTRLTTVLATISISLSAAGTALAAGNQGPAPGYGYGPGMMGPGMMYNWTPEQRQQHWEQMRQYGYGPGMMYNWTPEQRQQHWSQMQQYGYGPGMMGPGWRRGPGRWGGAPSGSGPQSRAQQDQSGKP